jgi:protein-tyrosine-phosphatase
MGTTTVEISGLATGDSFEAPARVSRRSGSEWIRDAKHLPDSILHARRRNAAQLEVQSVRPRSILFVCHGNICRSPFAAAAFSRACPPHLSERITVASAGFIGPDRSPPSNALTASARLGIEMVHHRSSLLTSARLQAADLVVVMSAEQGRGIRNRLRSTSVRVLVLGDLDPLPITRRTITDPWGRSESAFEAAYDRIERCARELARLVQDAS